MRPSRILSLSAVALAASAVLSACASGTASPDENGTINIGFIGSTSGAAASASAGTAEIFNAWIESVNATGGIAGHKLKGFVKDDASNAAKSVVAVKELVEQDKIVAIVGESTTNDTGWASYISDAGIPVLGAEVINATSFTNPDFYPVGGNIIALSYGQMKEAAKKGPKFANLYCAEAPACAQGVALYSALGASVGVQVALATPVSLTAIDYTAACTSLKDSGAQSYTIGAPPNVAKRIFDQCRQLGVKADLVSTYGIYSQMDFIPTGDFRGIEPTAPWFDSSIAATKEYQDLKRTYAPTLKNDSGLAMNVFISGKLFEAAVKASGSTTIDSASIKDGLYALKDETLGGLVGPISYVKDKPAFLNCYFVIGASGGTKFTTPEGIEPQCAPADVIAGVMAKLAG